MPDQRERGAKKILALDFDGVICNSEAEVHAVALGAYEELCPESSLLEMQSVDQDRFSRAFENLVPLGNRAEDFGVALRSLDQKVLITNQTEYDIFYSKQTEDWREAYHHEFYNFRENLRSKDLDNWLALHAPYSELIHYLKNLQDITLAVVTAKDGASVRLLLSHFGIPAVFADELIFDKSLGAEKTAHLKALKKRLNARFEDITFIDDKVRHLEAVYGLGVDPVLATWGYNTRREHELARTLGFRLARLENPSTILS